jgi:hypothetical protein
MILRRSGRCASSSPTALMRRGRPTGACALGGGAGSTVRQGLGGLRRDQRQHVVAAQAPWGVIVIIEASSLHAGPSRHRLPAGRFKCLAIPRRRRAQDVGGAPCAAARRAASRPQGPPSLARVASNPQ